MESFPLKMHRSRVYERIFLSIDRPRIIGVSRFFQRSGNVVRDARRDFCANSPALRKYGEETMLSERSKTCDVMWARINAVTDKIDIYIRRLGDVTRSLSYFYSYRKCDNSRRNRTEGLLNVNKRRFFLQFGLRFSS